VLRNIYEPTDFGWQLTEQEPVLNDKSHPDCSQKVKIYLAREIILFAMKEFLKRIYFKLRLIVESKYSTGRSIK